MRLRRPGPVSSDPLVLFVVVVVVVVGGGGGVYVCVC